MRPADWWRWWQMETSRRHYNHITHSLSPPVQRGLSHHLFWKIPPKIGRAESEEGGELFAWNLQFKLYIYCLQSGLGWAVSWSEGGQGKKWGRKGELEAFSNKSMDPTPTHVHKMKMEIFFNNLLYIFTIFLRPKHEERYDLLRVTCHVAQTWTLPTALTRGQSSTMCPVIMCGANIRRRGAAPDCHNLTIHDTTLSGNL